MAKAPGKMGAIWSVEIKSIMLENGFLYDLSLTQWILVFSCSFLVGMAKTGISSAGILVVPILAGIFGGKPSTGLLLPMLCFADLFAVKYYNRHADFNYIIRLIPYAFTGIILGLIIGHQISENGFRMLLGFTIACVGILMLLSDMKKKSLVIPDYWWFPAIMGLAGGFISMVGNAAGSVMALYFLSMRLPKNKFIGTTAWFFFIVNLIKVPFHFFVWKTITLETFLFDILQIPAIAMGAFLGIQIVKVFPEKIYRFFIIVSILISAILLFQK